MRALFIHADREPDTREIPDFTEVGYGPAPAPGDLQPGEALYQDMGKFYVVLSHNEDTGEQEVAYIRLFVHPDVLDLVKEHGKHEVHPPSVRFQ